MKFKKGDLIKLKDKSFEKYTEYYQGRPFVVSESKNKKVRVTDGNQNIFVIKTKDFEHI